MDHDIEKYKTELEKDCPTTKPPGAIEGTHFKLCRKIKQVIDFEVNGRKILYLSYKKLIPYNITTTPFCNNNFLNF